MRLLEFEEQKSEQLRKDLELGENRMMIQNFDSNKHLINGIRKRRLSGSKSKITFYFL